MIKKAIIFLFIGLIVISAFPLEGGKGVRIKKRKGNAGKRWAVCIGINDYEDKTIADLKKACNDAKGLGKVLKEYGQFDRVYVMTDDLNPRNQDYPKLTNIKHKMNYLKSFIDPQDLVLFSFSGHGITSSSGEGLLLTVDSYRDLRQEDSGLTLALKVKEIIEWFNELKVKKSLLLLDACREKYRKGKAVNLNGLRVERYLQARVGAVFYSTISGGFSYEDTKGNFGVFTRFVIDGLKGSADSKIAGNEDGIISFSELASYVEEGVSNWALDEGKKQRPYTRITGEKYGDLALSAYVMIGDKKKKEDEIKKTEMFADKPAYVKAVEFKAQRVYKNDKDLWEADYGDGILMVYIPAGKFVMGSKLNDDEKPPQKIYLDGYWMGKTEVTVKQFREFANEKEHVMRTKTGGLAFYNEYRELKNHETHPVGNASWNVANEYCRWLSDKLGLTFKLPTEAQWEKAARGTDGRKYPWGNRKPDKNLANCNHKFPTTTPIGSFPSGASPYGLLDMAGNACEWCRDWYSEVYYKDISRKNPKGPRIGTRRVVRGGNCYCWAEYVRCSNCLSMEPTGSRSGAGFRLCQENQ